MTWEKILWRVALIGFAAAGAYSMTIATLARPQATQQGSGSANLASSLFTLLDKNNDGMVTQDEMRSTFDGWYTQWDTKKTNALTVEQVVFGVFSVFPPPKAGEAPPQNQTPRPEDVAAMIAALPDAAPAKPQRPRKILALGRAEGFPHSSIPLAMRTIEEIGKKTGAWSTTITYDSSDINEANLKQYDAIFLASTTGAFLDDSNNAAATSARRKALLDFVRGGKGLAGVHAATDAYHRNSAAGSGLVLNMQALPLAIQLFGGDQNGDGRLSREELIGLANSWYEKLDSEKRGYISKADFVQRYAALPTPAPPMAALVQAPATDLTPDSEIGTWPEFNTMIGAIFKSHWNDGTSITVKIDDPKSPINAAFKGQEFTFVDEIYNFSRNTYSRANLHVLTSIDYAKMSAEDKAREPNPRSDGDYALSWIRREGKGRVFYDAFGHAERNYANKLFLQQMTAGMQYVLGDLRADDSPSAPAAQK